MRGDIFKQHCNFFHCIIFFLNQTLAPLHYFFLEPDIGSIALFFSWTRHWLHCKATKIFILTSLNLLSGPHLHLIFHITLFHLSRLVLKYSQSNIAIQFHMVGFLVVIVRRSKKVSVWFSEKQILYGWLTSIRNLNRNKMPVL